MKNYKVLNLEEYVSKAEDIEQILNMYALEGYSFVQCAQVPISGSFIIILERPDPTSAPIDYSKGL